MANLSNAPTLAVALTLPLCNEIVNALQERVSEAVSSARYIAERYDGYVAELANVDADDAEDRERIANRMSYEAGYYADHVGRYQFGAQALAAFGVEPFATLERVTLNAGDEDATAGSRDDEYANER